MRLWAGCFSIRDLLPTAKPGVVIARVCESQRCGRTIMLAANTRHRNITMRAFINAIAEAMRREPSPHCAQLSRKGNEGEGID